MLNGDFFNTNDPISQSKINSVNFDAEQIIPWGVSYQSQNVKKKIHTVKVAVLDSGVDKLHKDLKGKIMKEYNTINHNQPTLDEFGHGTAIAGIIASNDNNIGIVGVAPSVELYSVKVLGKDGKGEIDNFIEGIEWCTRNKIDIINISVGIKKGNEKLKEVITAAIDQGIIIVAAAGNNYRNEVDYPAAYEDVISVTAIDHSERVFNLAATGKIDFSAPGVQILTLSPNNGYSIYEGTSFATPHVTGIIANMLASSFYPSNVSRIKIIKDKLIGMSKDLGNKGYDEIYGYGSLSK
ncbi:S8 family peptidase [Paenibacillus sp. BAC0078]